MAIQQPQATDLLNSPDHSLSHRVIANDGSAPPMSIIIDSSGNAIFKGNATITGAILSDPIHIFDEIPSGVIDGSNPTFTLKNVPVTGTTRIYITGVRAVPGAGNDFTVSGNTITFTSGSIPATGVYLSIDYYYYPLLNINVSDTESATENVSFS